jgi:hypothetical protein
MHGEIMMYFGACGACGMHLTGIHGVDAVVGIVAFSGLISISQSLKVPSARSFQCRSGGGSKDDHFKPSPDLPFTVTWL